MFNPGNNICIIDKDFDVKPTVESLYAKSLCFTLGVRNGHSIDVHFTLKFLILSIVVSLLFPFFLLFNFSHFSRLIVLFHIWYAPLSGFDFIQIRIN